MNLLWVLSLGFSITNLLYFWTADNFGRWGMALMIAAVAGEVLYRAKRWADLKRISELQSQRPAWLPPNRRMDGGT